MTQLLVHWHIEQSLLALGQAGGIELVEIGMPGMIALTLHTVNVLPSIGSMVLVLDLCSAAGHWGCAFGTAAMCWGCALGQ